MIDLGIVAGALLTCGIRMHAATLVAALLLLIFAVLLQEELVRL